MSHLNANLPENLGKLLTDSRDVEYCNVLRSVFCFYPTKWYRMRGSAVGLFTTALTLPGKYGTKAHPTTQFKRKIYSRKTCC